MGTATQPLWLSERQGAACHGSLSSLFIEPVPALMAGIPCELQREGVNESLILVHDALSPCTLWSLMMLIYLFMVSWVDYLKTD